MTDGPVNRKRARAVSLFRELGLTEYEAQVYVALLRLGMGTAREISETTDVPRTRIYDATERLADRGFVDVQHASPKAFRPASRETAMRKLNSDTRRRSVSSPTNSQPSNRPNERTNRRACGRSPTGRS